MARIIPPINERPSNFRPKKINIWCFLQISYINIPDGFAVVDVAFVDVDLVVSAVVILVNVLVPLETVVKGADVIPWSVVARAVVTK